jgi:hypothetical protein
MSYGWCKFKISLQVQPIGHFKNNSPVLDLAAIRIVIRIHHIKIRYRFEPPLKTDVGIDVIDLIIVLKHGLQEYFL